MEYKQLIESTNAFKNVKSSFMADKLSQAYLFVCDDELTNKELIMHLARLFVCENKNVCGICSDCAKSSAGTHPDILIYPKGKSFAVSDAGHIYDNVQIKPMLSKLKIFIINNLDNSTEQAQNKILKIVEEPPENVIFLMSAKNENKVLQTIQSRSQKIYIDKINKELLKNIINAPENIKEIAISNGDGYLGKTLYIAENNEFLNNYNNMKNLLFNLKNSAEIPSFSKYLLENKTIFENSLIILNDFFRDLLMIKIGKNNFVKNSSLLVEYKTIIDEYSILALVEILKRLNSYKRKLDSNVNLTMLADGVLLEILEVKFLCK